ncbi:PREDICTED: uncharacterized protein LOC109185007 [Ipomoea nil]|uniref:uncharacterized protein LOC109185007 n=1 Tax=Ipomoea nil TaxID=35883 RepID=UPI000901F30F|nr:PREDICTED: uncharacterized protein LOC109185007 [Ipomoea nil]
MHGQRLIGNPSHYSNQGFVQCAASLNDAMHAFNRLRLDSHQVLDNPDADRDAFIRDVEQRSTDMMINTEYEFLLHVAPQQYFGAPMPDEPFGPRRADGRRDRPNMRGKTYVVFVGRQPEIYDNWEDAKTQVHRYSDNLYKSYNSRDEAIQAFNRFISSQRHDSQACSSNSASSSSSTVPNTNTFSNEEILARMQDELARENHEHAMKLDAIVEEFKHLLSK